MPHIDLEMNSGENASDMRMWSIETTINREHIPIIFHLDLIEVPLQMICK